MLFSNFITKIPIITTAPLGGLSSQFKLAPKSRIDFNDSLIPLKKPKEAAVLALIYPNSASETCILLTKRASYNGKHSAQISFVGGKSEKNEPVEESALREAFEEIGIVKKQVNIIRELTTTYIPPSNFLVFPFLAYCNKTPNFNPNYEVAEILNVKLTDLLRDKNKKSTVIETSYMKAIDTPFFSLNNQTVWGATAMILSEIKDLLKQNL